jgi:hypothetical protein
MSEVRLSHSFYSYLGLQLDAPIQGLQAAAHAADFYTSALQQAAQMTPKQFKRRWKRLSTRSLRT